MKTLRSTTRTQGGSIATTIPAEVARKMGLEAGDDLFWLETGEGSFHVLPDRPDIRDALEAHEEVMEEYRDVFRALAE